MTDLVQVSGRRHIVERVVVACILIAALCAPVLLGLATSYLIALLAIAGVAVLLLSRGVDWRPDGMSWVMLSAFALLLVVTAVTARTPDDLRFALNFVALVLYWPLSVLIRRGARPGNARTVANLALIGTLAALAVSYVEVGILGAPRAGNLLTDPIRLANTAVILAFLAVALGSTTGSARRWLYLIGPVCAFAVVFLTAARIAMVAFPVLAVAAIMLLSRRKLVGLAVATGATLLLAAIALLNIFDNARLDLLLDSVGNVIAGRPLIGDEAVRIRLALYEAGWQAFQQSPIFGHGWGRMMSAAGEFLAESDQVHVGLPHLHNEALSFAVFAGVIGVVVYAAIMAAPIVMALRSPHDSQRMARIHGTIVLVLAYAVMGLTDTMLSFELHTALFVAWSAVLLCWCRDAPPEGWNRQQ